MSSVMVKQSWTMPKSSSLRGFFIPASWYASSAALIVAGKDRPVQPGLKNGHWVSTTKAMAFMVAYLSPTSLLAISGLVSTTAAEPSDNAQQSKRGGG